MKPELLVSTVLFNIVVLLFEQSVLALSVFWT